MLYIIHEEKSGSLVAIIDAEEDKVRVSKGYQIIKADIGDIFKKRDGEFDFPVDWV